MLNFTKLNQDFKSIPGIASSMSSLLALRVLSGSSGCQAQEYYTVHAKYCYKSRSSMSDVVFVWLWLPSDVIGGVTRKVIWKEVSSEPNSTDSEVSGRATLGKQNI